MSDDLFEAFKDRQRQMWASFSPTAMFTTPVAAHLVAFGAVAPGEAVLDVGTGTGVVAVTAARAGAKVKALDLTPALLEDARENARIAGVAVEWIEGDAERLPYPDGAFDVVLSQFGHMFAPRPDVAVAEMRRVLKPRGFRDMAAGTFHGAHVCAGRSPPSAATRRRTASAMGSDRDDRGASGAAFRATVL